MAAFVLLLATGCTMFGPEDDIKGNGGSQEGGFKPSMEIAPEYAGSTAELPPYSKGRLTTRSLISNETTVSMRANFLRIDEDLAADDSGLYTYTASANPSSSPYYKTINWANSYLIEATLMSSPDRANVRSAYLNPVQTYKMRIFANDNDELDTLNFYHTRMVSWYPMTCGDGEGVAPICKFGEVYGDQMVEGVDSNGNGYVAIKMTGLDGQTDIMVSDVREGQHWHSPDTPADAPHYQSNRVPAGHPTLAAGTNTYAPPFGSHQQDRIINSNGETTQWAVDYDNHFTYRHYLSAVRIFAHAEQSPQNLSMWGKLEHVTIVNQPTSVKIMLPTKPGEWGEAFDWGDVQDFDIVTGRIFGDGDTNSPLTEEAKYPISFQGMTGKANAYLGYALVCPDHDVEILLHTTTGIYSVVIPSHYVDKNGQETDIFHESNIYDITLNLRTNGTIAALLEKEEDKIYYDLTRLTVYANPEEDGGGSFAIYHYANTHIVSPDHTPAFDEDGNKIYEADGVTPKYIKYDGYCFDATTIGNGQSGIISYGTSTLYPSTASINPRSARLLWESKLGLVTNVELMYGYVRFRVPDHSSRGNAVIAVYDDDGKVLWSWHIWITDPPQNKTYKSGSTEVVLLDRNLGATKAEWTGASDALDTYGLYYQWGRKDPSMGPKSYNYEVEDLITWPYYDYSSRERTAAEVAQFARPTTKDGVENPMFLIMPTAQQQAYYFNWIYEKNDILWGYHEDDQSMLKTIYDPCPHGYRVPLHSELSQVFANTANRTDYGQRVRAADNSYIYFPYAGFKGVDRDLQSLVLSWNYVGQKGDYMTSTISKDNSTLMAEHPILDHRGRVYITKAESWEETLDDSYTYDTNDTYRMLDYANRRTAASVRCVKNYASGALGVRISPSQDWFVPGSEITLHCEGVTTESFIQWAEIVVRNIDKGTSKVLYTTPAGRVEANQPIWERDEIFVVGVKDGEFWSESGYEFILTCKNELGVQAKSITSISNHKHTMEIDLTQWKEADYAESPLYNLNTYTRRFVVKTEGQSDVPQNVKMVFDDGSNSITLYPTRISSVGVNHTYEVTFDINTVGARNFTISAQCANFAAHIAKATFNVTYVERTLHPLELYFRPQNSKWFYWNNEEITFDWWAASPNGNLTKVEIVYDYGTGAPLNPGSPAYEGGSVVYSVEPNAPSVGSSSAPSHFVFKSAVQADYDGRLQAEMNIEDEWGKTASQQHSCYIIYADYEGWEGVHKPNENITLGVIVSGGAEPNGDGVKAVINGSTVTFAKDNSYSGTSGRYSDTRWRATLSLPEGTYNNIPLTLTFWEGELSTTAPTLTVANAMPISVSISASTTSEIFYGDKTSGSISVSASSPNGNLTRVVVRDNKGNTIYSNNSVNSSGVNINNITSQSGFRGGENVTYTIEATDEAGMSATATTPTISKVYKVTKKTAVSFTTSANHIIENNTYGTYLYDATVGTNNSDVVTATSTLSSDVFMRFSGTGATQRFTFVKTQQNISGGNSNNASLEAYQSNSYTTQYAVAYTGGYFRIFRDNTNTNRDFYWRQQNATTVDVNNSTSNNSNWNIYEVTLE